MLFNSAAFFLFLAGILCLFYLVPARFRWIIMLAGSYFFYMSWDIYYVLLIASSTLVDYGMGLLLQDTKQKSTRRIWLLISLISNFGLLFAFKYLGFAVSIANDLGANFKIAEYLLPVGISFYTFQTISYTIDVYKGKMRAEKHLGYFALYVIYFPQLVAGPIERYGNLAPQLRFKQSWEWENASRGVRLILYGLFAKMVVADNLAPLVDQVFGHPELYSTASNLLGMFMYSFQIYGDFFGYSSIAIGVSLFFGVQLMNNFHSPYLATGLVDFWRRWHISLSTWFRDYLYFPLGGSRVNTLKWLRNVLVVFLLSGIWHGANWTFIVWGGIHGLFYFLEVVITTKLKWSFHKHIPLFVRRLLTFCIVTFAWVFFRSPSLDHVWLMFTSLSGSGNWHLHIPIATWLFLGLFLALDRFTAVRRIDVLAGAVPTTLRWGVYGVFIFIIIAFSGVNQAPFIYFQF